MVDRPDRKSVAEEGSPSDLENVEEPIRGVSKTLRESILRDFGHPFPKLLWYGDQQVGPGFVIPKEDYVHPRDRTIESD